MVFGCFVNFVNVVCLKMNLFETGRSLKKKPKVWYMYVHRLYKLCKMNQVNEKNL